MVRSRAIILDSENVRMGCCSCARHLPAQRVHTTTRIYARRIAPAMAPGADKRSATRSDRSVSSGPFERLLEHGADAAHVGLLSTTPGSSGVDPLVATRAAPDPAPARHLAVGAGLAATHDRRRAARHSLTRPAVRQDPTGALSGDQPARPATSTCTTGVDQPGRASHVIDESLDGGSGLSHQ